MTRSHTPWYPGPFLPGPASLASLALSHLLLAWCARSLAHGWWLCSSIPCVLCCCSVARVHFGPPVMRHGSAPRPWCAPDLAALRVSSTMAILGRPYAAVGPPPPSRFARSLSPPQLSPLRPLGPRPPPAARRPGHWRHGATGHWPAWPPGPAPPLLHPPQSVHYSSLSKNAAKESADLSRRLSVDSACQSVHTPRRKQSPQSRRPQDAGPQSPARLHACTSSTEQRSN